MAREFAMLRCSMSDDPDFNRLSPEAQLVYLRLAIRPQLSRVGVTTPAAAVLADQTGLNTDSVKAALAELRSARFVVYDPETGELLVRAKLRCSGYSNAKHEKGARVDAESVMSPAIIRTLVSEANRLGWDWHDLLPGETTLLDTLSDRVSDRDSSTVSGSVSGTHPDTPLSELCSLNSESLNSESESESEKIGRAADPIWDALVACFGPPTNANDRGRRNTAVKLLRETMATKNLPPEQHHDAVLQLRDAYLQRHPDVACTPTAIASNADVLIAHIRGLDKARTPKPTKADQRIADTLAAYDAAGIGGT